MENLIMISFFLVLVLTVEITYSFTLKYKNGPITITPDLGLYHETNLSSSSINIGLSMSTGGMNKKPKWIGFGIGEPSSGSMLGSDILTIRMDEEQKICKLEDRYVPFNSYPMEQHPLPYPKLDSCNYEDWKLIACNISNEALIIEVKRKLMKRVGEPHDRSIVSGENKVLFAWGFSQKFQYHGNENRISKSLVFYNHGNDIPATFANQDGDGFIDINNTDFTIPYNKLKTHACTSYNVTVPKAQPNVTIVAAQAFLQNGHVEYIRRMSVFLCENENYADATKQTINCENAPFRPIGNPFAKCSTFIYTYARGIKRMDFPPDAGIILDPHKKQFIVLYTQYDNSNGRHGMKDSSGIRLHYELTQRKHSIGSLLIGDPLSSRTPGKVMSSRLYQHTCPSICTQRLDGDMSIINAFTYMEHYGRTISINQYDSKNNFKKSVSKVNFWNEKFQHVHEVHNVTINKMDQLSLTCVYDINKGGNVEFGLDLNNELCMAILHYYPKRVDIFNGHYFNLCIFQALQPGSNTGITICADNSKLEQFFTMSDQFPNALNPSFNDSHFLFSEFANPRAPNVCPINSSQSINSYFSYSPSPTSSSTPPPSPSAISSITIGDLDENEEDDEDTSIGSEPNIQMSASPDVLDDNDGAACFPSDSIVIVKLNDTRHRKIQMKDLKFSDEVYVGKGQYSSIYSFSHYDASINWNRFVTFYTFNNLSITLSEGHYIYTHNNNLKSAKHVSSTDRLVLHDGSTVRIRKILYRVSNVGLINPHTMHGDIVVNEFIASTFTTEVKPKNAMALLAPFRWCGSSFKHFGQSFNLVVQWNGWRYLLKFIRKSKYIML